MMDTLEIPPGTFDCELKWLDEDYWLEVEYQHEYDEMYEVDDFWWELYKVVRGVKIDITNELTRKEVKYIDALLRDTLEVDPYAL